MSARPTDPELLFDLHADPDETNNLADDPEYSALMDTFRQEQVAHWDVGALREEVIRDQVRRRRVHAALRCGRYETWDYQPARDASEEYTRSHHELSDFDVRSRFPRPPAFKPRYR